jgi:hypothetical protein
VLLLGAPDGCKGPASDLFVVGLQPPHPTPLPTDQVRARTTDSGSVVGESVALLDRTRPVIREYRRAANHEHMVIRE